MFFTSPLAQASSNSDFEMSPLPSLSTCVKLTINGAAADFASRSPDGTALFQIAEHCSAFRAAEGRPDVMVFVCASAQVAANGSTTREMMDALNICLLLRSCQAPKRSAGASVNELKLISFMQGGVGCDLIKPTTCERVPEDERISKGTAAAAPSHRHQGGQGQLS